MTICKPLYLLTACVSWGLVLVVPATGQETAYAFNTKCFTPSTTPSTDGIAPVVQMSVLPNAPTECSSKAFSIISTKDAVDAQLKKNIDDLQKNIDDLTTKAISAIKASIAENSVKAGEIDAVAKSIEDKIYENVLRRVRADIQAAQPNRPAGAHQ